MKGYISPTVGQLTLTEMVAELVAFLAEDPQAAYQLVIGTDSQEGYRGKEKLANYVTAVVVHRQGKGGRYFWRNGKKEKVLSLRQKIYTETSLSLEAAGELVPRLRQRLNGLARWSLEIHVDIGQSGQTREMIAEVVGMVKGNGYEACTKPEAYAASSVADKHA